MACLGLALAAPAAFADVFTVTSIVDGAPGSLREAITAANTTPGPDTIVFSLDPASLPPPPWFAWIESALPTITDDLTITGPGSDLLVIGRRETAPPFGILSIAPARTVVIESLQFIRGAGVDGGAIASAGAGSLIVRDCAFRQCVVSANGGAISVAGDGDTRVEIIRSRFSDSAAGSTGGAVSIRPTSGIATVVINAAFFDKSSVMPTLPGRLGGALFLAGGDGPHTLDITASTFLGNTVPPTGFGGALHFNARSGTLNLLNSTFAGNSAEDGAVLDALDAAVSVRSCTVTQNALVGTPAPAGKSVFRLAGASAISAVNSIISGNAAGSEFRDLRDDQLISANHNLIGVGGALAPGAAGNIVGVTDPKLAPLNELGGPTPTFALRPDSPALDAGSATDAPSIDQRGQPRPSDGNFDLTPLPDIGAFETLQFIVASPANSGPGSLRQAILDNNLAGGGFVRFRIPGAGPTRRIAPSTPLPPIARPIVIDAWSQAGMTYAGRPVVELDGVNITGPGIDLLASDSIIRGLAVNAFKAPAEGADPGLAGIGLVVRSNTGNRNWIYACWFGLALDGATPRPNHQAGIALFDEANSNLIGSNADGLADAAEANIIVGSSIAGLRTGIFVQSNSNQVSGNYIGVAADGLTPIPNSTGIRIDRLGANNRIGAGVGVTMPVAARNVISGNLGHGVVVATGTGAGNSVAGNIIGLGADGLTPAPNGAGILIDNAINTSIGGALPGSGNVVSANLADAVRITGPLSTGCVVLGNTIGLSLDRQNQRANAGHGLVIENAAAGARVGTFGDGTPADTLRRNVISGNAGRAVVIRGPDTFGVRIAGNTMGLAEDGSTAFPNREGGILIDNAPAAVIGGPGLQRNVIASNGANATGPGIELAGPACTDTSIINNSIGVGPNGERRGNAGAGVRIAAGASRTIVGGTDPDHANLIARNLGGILVIDDDSRANVFLQNTIGPNAGLGIDLANDGATPNAPPGVVRVGPNDLQNAPVLRAVASNGAAFARLDAAPDSDYRIEFFASDAPDHSGFGEGIVYLGSVNVSTDAAGRSPEFTFQFTPDPARPWITATSTDLASLPAFRDLPGSSSRAMGTSEFSNAVRINTPPSASPALAATSEDSDAVLTLAGDDADPGAQLRATIASLPTAGTLLQFDTLAPVGLGDQLSDPANRVIYRPPANAFGIALANFEFAMHDGADASAPAQARIDVAPAADTPAISDASTVQGRQTTSGLIVSRNPADGPEVTHFKIISATDGDLFLSDGVTPALVGSFISAAQADAGLRFTPQPAFVGVASVRVQASIGASDSGLGGGIAAANVTVSRAALPPIVTGAVTLEDTPSTSGLIITPAVGNGPEVTHFKIVALQTGALTLADASTPVAVGQFITAAQGAAGLRFIPPANFNGQVELRVAASTSPADAGIDNPPAVATILVTPVNDQPTPIVSAAPTAPEDAPTIVLSAWASMNPGPPDESSQTVLAFLLSDLTNPALFDLPPSIDIDGTLTFRPAPGKSGVATFNLRVRDSGGTADSGVDLSAPVPVTIRIEPVNDAPSFIAADPPAVLEGSGPILVPAWVTAFDPGGPDESAQNPLEYLVDAVSNPSLFAVLPSVSVSGNLTYTLAPAGFGSCTFRVRVRDTGGTSNAGIDTSAPSTFTITSRPAAACTDIVLDARTSCLSRILSIDQVHLTPRDAGPGAAQTVLSDADHSIPFPIGVTPVRITVRYSDGLVSSCVSRVTVLAGDCNNNALPDSCDVAAGLGSDCNADGFLDSCACFWDNGAAPAPSGGSKPDGQLSHLGGGSPQGAKVADDFYLTPGAIHRIFAFTGTMLTSSLPELRKARLEFYEDCDGVPAFTPFRTFVNSRVVASEPAGAGFDLVTYAFEFCDDSLYLEGGRSYWVSLIGITDGQGTDTSYWASTVPFGAQGAITGAAPFKALGLPSSNWNDFLFEPWQVVNECCIGCVNFAFRLSGEACPLVWDNAKPDLGPAIGGTPSGANRSQFPQPRAADNFLIKPCSSAEVCYIEATIFTNCDPLIGFIEIYDNLCRLPTGAPLYRAQISRAEPIGRSITVDGTVLEGRRLILTGINWTLPGGKDYWISAGASSNDALNTRSLFARSADCKRACQVRISPGAAIRQLGAQSDDWEQTGIDYAFRIFRRPDPPSAPSGSGSGSGSGAGIPGCAGDFNRDGFLSAQDVFDFLSAYFTTCP